MKREEGGGAVGETVWGGGEVGVGGVNVEGQGILIYFLCVGYVSGLAQI